MKKEKKNWRKKYLKPEDKNQNLEYLQHNVEVLNQIWNIADPPVESHKPLIGGVVILAVAIILFMVKKKK